MDWLKQPLSLRQTGASNGCDHRLARVLTSAAVALQLSTKDALSEVPMDNSQSKKRLKPEEILLARRDAQRFGLSEKVVRTVYRLLLGQGLDVVRARLEAIQQEIGDTGGPIDTPWLVSLSTQICKLTPLLERAVQETTREQRVELRQMLGDDGMFRLSKASSRLCSEKALEIGLRTDPRWTPKSGD